MSWEAQDTSAIGSRESLTGWESRRLTQAFPVCGDAPAWRDWSLRYTDACRGVRCRCAPVGGLGEGRAVPWSTEEQMNSQEQEGPAMWTSHQARTLSWAEPSGGTRLLLKAAFIHPHLLSWAGVKAGQRQHETWTVAVLSQRAVLGKLCSDHVVNIREQPWHFRLRIGFNWVTFVDQLLPSGYGSP